MLDSKGLDVLTRTDEHTAKINPENSKKYLATKRRINGLCKSLSTETKEYKPEKTVDSIENYIKTKDKMERILYSEISNHLFNLGPEQRVIFLTNVERLLIYSLGTDSITLDAAKIIVKIYDHTQLVNYQIESMNNIFAQRIAEAKVDLHKEIKGVEKEYITILGIFASIILTFVGAFTFSTSVLNNIGNVDIIELFVIALLIGLVLFNLIAYLIDFLKEINDKVGYDVEKKKKIGSYRRTINIIFVGLIVVILVVFGLSKVKLPEKVYIGVTQEQVDCPTEVEDND